MLAANFSKKEIFTYGIFVSPSFVSMGRSFIFNIWRVYLILAELVSSPLANPPAIVFSVLHMTLSPSSLDGSFPFLDLRLLILSHTESYPCLILERSHP